MPLRVKQLFEEAGLSLAFVAAGCSTPKSTMHAVLNDGVYPKKTEEFIQYQLLNLARKIQIQRGGVREHLLSAEHLLSFVGEDEEESLMDLDFEVMNFFNFHRQPFRHDVQNDEDMYMTRTLLRAEDVLISAGKHKGLVALLGGIGAGKTELWRRVEEKLIEDDVIVVKTLPDNQEIKVVQIVEQVLTRLGHDRLPNTIDARKRLFSKALENLKKEGRTLVYVSEECHAWAWQTLRSLKWFYENHVGRSSLMGLIFIGNLHFKTLVQSRVPELYNRLSIIQLPEYTKKEACEYLQHKLHRAGNAKIFENGGLEAIYDRVLRANERPIPLMLNRTTAAYLQKAFKLRQVQINSKLVMS